MQYLTIWAGALAISLSLSNNKMTTATTDIQSEGVNMIRTFLLDERKIILMCLGIVISVCAP